MLDAEFWESMPQTPDMKRIRKQYEDMRDKLEEQKERILLEIFTVSFDALKTDDR